MHCPLHGVDHDSCEYLEVDRQYQSQSFRKGDRVRLIRNSADTREIDPWKIDPWKEFSTGVLTSDFLAGQGGHGKGSGCYHIRFDNYDYRDPNNHHFVAELEIELEEPSVDEIQRAFGVEEAT